MCCWNKLFKSRSNKKSLVLFFFIFGYYKYQYSTGLRAKRCFKFFLSLSLFLFSFKAFPPSQSRSWSNQSVFRLWCRNWGGDRSRRPPTCLGSGAVRSWRSCWPWSARGRAAARWWSAALWMDACSPWRWRGASAAAHLWTPAGASWTRSPARLCRGPVPYACMLGSRDRKRVFVSEGRICWIVNNKNFSIIPWPWIKITPE